MIKWHDTYIENTNKPKSFKKITGTRFASILGANRWSSPFEVWCALTRTYEEPFEDTIYTLAGKAIEPLQIEYMRNAYAMDNLLTPTDKYGKDYFKLTRGDFFSAESKIFGGMWDALLVDEYGEPSAVLEFKTTKRAEDWQDDIPEYYALQAALYAYLLGVDEVIMVASFLSDKDYDAPDKYEPSAENTITRSFKVSERYPSFSRLISKANSFWVDHVERGISPEFEEKRDADILKVLRTKSVDQPDDLEALLKEAGALKAAIDKHDALMDKQRKRLKEIKEIAKEYIADQVDDGSDYVKAEGGGLTWTLRRNIKTTRTCNFDALPDDVYEKYVEENEKVSWTLTVK